jgi:hypothetical protein
VALAGEGIDPMTEPPPTPPSQASSSGPPLAPPATPQVQVKPPASRLVEISFRSGYSTVGLRRSRACRGRVTLELRKGKTLLARTTVTLDRHCRYKTRFSVRRSAVGATKTLTVIARFRGNRFLGATSNRFTVRVP